jgi:hypothetical protein
VREAKREHLQRGPDPYLPLRTISAETLAKEDSILFWPAFEGLGSVDGVYLKCVGNKHWQVWHIQVTITEDGIHPIKSVPMVQVMEAVDFLGSTTGERFEEKGIVFLVPPNTIRRWSRQNILPEEDDLNRQAPVGNDPEDKQGGQESSEVGGLVVRLCYLGDCCVGVHMSAVGGIVAVVVFIWIVCVIS